MAKSPNNKKPTSPSIPVGANSDSNADDTSKGAAQEKPPSEFDKWTLGQLRKELSPLLARLSLGSVVKIGIAAFGCISSIFLLGAKFGGTTTSTGSSGPSVQLEKCRPVTGLYYSTNTESYAPSAICAAPGHSTLYVSCDASGTTNFYEFSINRVFTTSRSSADLNRDCGAAPSDTLLCTYGSEWEYNLDQEWSADNFNMTGKVLRRVYIDECGIRANLGPDSETQLHSMKTSLAKDYQSSRCTIQLDRSAGSISGLRETCFYNGEPNRPHAAQWLKRR